MARTIEEHQAAFTQAGADGHKQTEAFGYVVGDLIDARAEVERLAGELGRTRGNLDDLMAAAEAEVLRVKLAEGDRLAFEQTLCDIVNGAWSDGEMGAVERARKALAARRSKP